ncbi:hypothetical protein ABIE26_002989 [Pedobacter africanus]|uniref:hypothetical protein n=1 Tax=Pedobacter africanus TaxID=151894 RepID=UPI00339AD43D
MAKIHQMNNEVFLLGALAQKQYHLLVNQTSKDNFQIPTYISLDEARKEFIAFDFLYSKRPENPIENRLQQFLEQIHLFIIKIPEAALDTLENRIDQLPEHPKKISWINFYGNDAVLAPLTSGQCFGSKFMVFHLYADILNCNKKIESPLRQLEIGRITDEDPNYFALRNLLKNTNAN